MTKLPEVQFTRPQLQHIQDLRDADRRFYRKNVIFLLGYTFAIVAPVRLAIDLAVSQPKFNAEFLKPYGIVFIVFLVILLWVVGLHVVFRRRY